MKHLFSALLSLARRCQLSDVSCQLSVVSCLFFHGSVALALQSQTTASTAAPQPLEQLVSIEFRTDPRIFAVTAALNAAGFDYERAGNEMSDLRRTVRHELQDLSPALQERLTAFYKSRRTSTDESDEQAAYISLALLLSDPPDFTFPSDPTGIPSDAWHIRGFGELVRELYEKEGLESLWQQYQARYGDELQAYKPVFKDAILETLRYFRIPPRIVLDRRIILIPDLLNARNVVNARNLEHVYYIVVGPTDNPADNYRQLQHEYLHFLIDPLAEKFGGTLLKYKDLSELAHNQPRLKKQYRNNFLLLVTESLIETLLLRFHPPANPQTEILDLFRQGLVFVPYFYRGLEQYEKSDLISFPSYVESLFQGIAESEIKSDAQAMAALDERAKANEQERLKAEREASEQQARRQRLNSLLREAGALLSEKNFDAAVDTINRILEEDPGNGNAFFYLAQIASQRERFDEAFQYYDRAAASSNIGDGVRAWCLVRMGRYLAYQGQFQKAASHFSQVLKMEGDLQGAREEAERSLKQLPPR